MDAAQSVGAGPVASAERIELLDTLRGLALFGIFLVNFNHDYLAESRYLIDRVARMAIDFCCEGSFYPLFSFLFGLGFALQLQRSTARGGAFDRRYLRRLAVLFGIGVAHGILLWRGDVLWRYALLGVLLLAVGRLRSRMIVVLAGLSFAGAVVSDQIVSREPPNAPPAGSTARQTSAAVSAEANLDPAERYLIQHGSYGELVGLRARIEWQQARHLYRDSWLFLILSMFLLGLLAGRERILSQPAQHRVLLQRLLWGGLAVGVMGNFLHVVAPSLATRGLLPWAFADLHAAKWVGDPGLSCFYGAGVTLLVTGDERWRERLSPLAKVGRMALTNYLCQSLTMLLLMAGFGLGLAFRFSYALAIPLKVSIFAAQLMASRWWLRRFQFGPVEWLWRWATYGEPPAWRVLSRA